MENSKENNETNNLDAVAEICWRSLIFSALAAKSKAKQTEKTPEPEEKPIRSRPTSVSLKLFKSVMTRLSPLRMRLPDLRTAAKHLKRKQEASKPDRRHQGQTDTRCWACGES